MLTMAAPPGLDISDGHAFDFEDAVRAIWPRAVRTAYAIIGCMPTAQDITQDACLIAHRKRNSLRDIHGFDSWLLTIVVRQAYRAAKRGTRTQAIELDRHIDPNIAAIVDIRRALDGIPSKLRIAIVLCDVLQYTGDEAAYFLGIPAATVRNRIFRGRRILAATLANYAPKKREMP